MIALTEELLETAKQNENFVSAINTSASTSDTLQMSDRIAQYEMVVPRKFSKYIVREAVLIGCSW